MVSVLPSSITSGFSQINPAIPMTIPQKSARKKPVEASTLAVSSSCIPNFREIILPQPCPNINPNACKIAINPNTIPTAPLALLPNVPTKAVSAIL